MWVRNSLRKERWDNDGKRWNTSFRNEIVIWWFFLLFCQIPFSVQAEVSLPTSLGLVPWPLKSRSTPSMACWMWSWETFCYPWSRRARHDDDQADNNEAAKALASVWPPDSDAPTVLGFLCWVDQVSPCRRQWRVANASWTCGIPVKASICLGNCD